MARLRSYDGERETPEMRARRRVDRQSREFNISLWRIAHAKYGQGGLTSDLAAITGLSRETIRARVNQCEESYPPPPLPIGEYNTRDDIRYRDIITHSEHDPGTRDFLQGLNGARRRHPDHEDPRVCRKRIARADGTARLTSESIGLRRN